MQPIVTHKEDSINWKLNKIPAKLHIFAVFILLVLNRGDAERNGTQFVPGRRQQLVVATTAGPSDANERFDHIHVGFDRVKNDGFITQVLQQLIGNGANTVIRRHIRSGL